MPASSSMIVSCAVALSFAAAVSAGAQVDAQGSASLHRVLRRQSHGIELAADQLVARSTSEKRKTDTPVAAENKEERQVVECGHGLQIALSANTAVDDVVRACQNKVKRTYDSRIKAKRLAKPEEEDAVEEQKRWVLTDWIAEDDKQDSSFDSDIQINDEAEDEEESASSKKPSNQSVKLAADDEDSETQDEAEVDIPEEEDYEEESYAPYRGEHDMCRPVFPEQCSCHMIVFLLIRGRIRIHYRNCRGNRGRLHDHFSSFSRRQGICNHCQERGSLRIRNLDFNYDSSFLQRSRPPQTD